jgi:hypothetical protein
VKLNSSTDVATHVLGLSSSVELLWFMLVVISSSPATSNTMDS